MATINLLTVTENQANVGIGKAWLDPGKITGFFLVDKSFSINSTYATTIQDSLAASCLATGLNRIYPVYGFGEITDNTEDETVNTTGYGNKTLGNEGKYDWTFRILQGGLSLQKNLRKFNAGDWSVYLVDENNKIYGSEVGGVLYPLSLDFFYAKKWKVADGSNPAMYMVRLAFSNPAELNDTVGFIECDFDVEQTIKGIIDVTITKISSSATNIVVSLTYGPDASNLGDLYNGELDVAGAWVLTKAGTPVVISGVTYDAATGYFTIAFSSATGDHVLNLASAADLAALNVGGSPTYGYESTGSITAATA